VNVSVLLYVPVRRASGDLDRRRLQHRPVGCGAGGRV